MDSGVVSNASGGDKLEQQSPCRKSTCGENDCLQQARCSSCSAQDGASQAKSAKDMAIVRLTLHNFAKLRRLALTHDLFLLPIYVSNMEAFAKEIREDPKFGLEFDNICQRYGPSAVAVAYKVAKQVTKDLTEEERPWAKGLRERNDEVRRREKSQELTREKAEELRQRGIQTQEQAEESRKRVEKIQEQARERAEDSTRRSKGAAERVKQEIGAKHEQPRQGFAAMSQEAQNHLITQYQAQVALQKQLERQAAVKMTVQPASDRIGKVSAVPTLNKAQNHTRKSDSTPAATSTPPQGVKGTFPWSWKRASTVPQQPRDTMPYDAPPSSPNQTASHPELSRASTTTSSTLLPYHHLNPQTTYPSQQNPALSKCSHVACSPVQNCNVHLKALEANVPRALPENHVPSTTSNLHTSSPKATINNPFRAALKSSSSQATALPPLQDPIKAPTTSKIDAHIPLPAATTYGPCCSSRAPVSTTITTPAVALRPKGETTDTDRPRAFFLSGSAVTPRPMGEIKDTDRPCETFFSAPAVTPRPLSPPTAVAPRLVGETKDTDHAREFLSFFCPSADWKTASVSQPPTASLGPSTNPSPAPQQKATIKDSLGTACRGNFETEEENESFRKRDGLLLEDLTDNDDFAVVKTSDIEDDADWDIIKHSDGEELEPVDRGELADEGGSVRRDWDAVVVSGKGWGPVDVNGMGVWGTG